MEERDDVEETGDGIAVTLVVGAETEVAFVLVDGANKFDIVGECFLLFDCVTAIPLGDDSVGDEAIVGTFALGDEEDNVVEVLVLVDGILLFTVAVELEDGVFPFGIVAAVLDAWPLFCSAPT